MTVSEGRVKLREEIYPSLARAFALLPTDATNRLGGLSFIEMMDRVEHSKEDQSFEDALRNLVTGTSSAGINATLQCLGDKVALSQASSFECLLICRELLNNALKHSGTTELQVLLMSNENELVITLADNGRGMAQNSETMNGQGLKDLRERVAALGGTIDQTEADDGGVVYLLKLPQNTANLDHSSEERLLGKKIHDGLCQELAVLRMMVTHHRDTVEDPAAWKAARDAAKLIEKVCEDARELSHQLLEEI